MIPEAAVEAAMDAMYHAQDCDVTAEDVLMRAALEAAAPHMRQAFFLEMNLRAVQDELKTPLKLGRAIHGND